MRYYCTFFDRNYAAKGLAMINSLIRHSAEKPEIHVLAMDEQCQSILSILDAPVRGWRMSLFESETGIGELKKTRTHQEYCWTVTSVFTSFIANYLRKQVTYLDADTFFFSDPEPVFQEIGEKPIAITPHRFAKKDEERLLPNGKYAVQWVTFDGEIGRVCAAHWASQCRQWCYYRQEDGKFADQKYLDEWPEVYRGNVCEISNPGCGLAPWNVANYRIEEHDGRVAVDGMPLILYHFHEYIHGQRLTNWVLRAEDRNLIYAPYSQAIAEAQKAIDSAAIYL